MIVPFVNKKGEITEREVQDLTSRIRIPIHDPIREHLPILDRPIDMPIQNSYFQLHKYQSLDTLNGSPVRLTLHVYFECGFGDCDKDTNYETYCIEFIQRRSALLYSYAIRNEEPSEY